MNILITNIGRRGYLVDFIRETASFDGKLYASDCDRTASGLYSKVDKSFLLPKPNDDEEAYVDALIKLCIKYNIGLVIPVIDPEIFILSKYIDEFGKNGITLLVSNKEVLEICYDKIKMNDFLWNIGLNITKSYDNIEVFKLDFEKKNVEFPVFVKPIYGSGSIGSKKINNLAQLITSFRSGMIIQEYLDGLEYGIDAFVKKNGVPLRIVVKKKLSMRSGETDKAITVKHKRIQNIVQKLAVKLKPFGPLDIDVIETDMGVHVIDINPRFGGGYPSTYMAGVNFIDIIIKLLMNVTINPNFNNYKIGQITMKDVGLKTINEEDDRYRVL